MYWRDDVLQGRYGVTGFRGVGHGGVRSGMTRQVWQGSVLNGRVGSVKARTDGVWQVGIGVLGQCKKRYGKARWSRWSFER